MFVWSKRQALALLRSQPPHQRTGSFGSLSPEELQENPRRLDPEEATDRSFPGALEAHRPFGWAPSADRDARVELGEFSSEDDGEKSEIIWEHMLDLGAGDGYVTQILASHARHVHVTEASSIMRRRLRDRGYTVLDTWNWAEERPDVHYDVISCLNLLDRCDIPRSLLATISSKIAPGGTLVVALVLPFTPYVEFGSADHLPSEDLGVTGSTIEEQVVSLGQDVFPSLGLQVQSWTRLPYLCEGDLDQAFYWLSDIIFVLKREEPDGSDVAAADGDSSPGAMAEDESLLAQDTFHDTVEDFERKSEL
ncbi:protein-L-histidine N-pros-methyltransferase-like [Oratosquilla oratoria]|uniref:protein-L-histidine N-pros-methyltransferase-like n=1 Tax=Oratosquilla oratoria TaxID=337810 RepID=UPI003F76DCE3